MKFTKEGKEGGEGLEQRRSGEAVRGEREKGRGLRRCLRREVKQGVGQERWISFLPFFYAMATEFTRIIFLLIQSFKESPRERSL